MLKDIANFNNLNDYLPLLNAILLLDIVAILLATNRIFDYAFLREWYQKFLLSAVIADVALIILVFIIARAVYYNVFDKFSIIQFIFIAVIIQICHDMLFYVMISNIPKGTNKILDFFQDYAKDASYGAIIGGSIVVILIALMTSYLANFNTNTNIILMILTTYLLQYVLYNN